MTILPALKISKTKCYLQLDRCEPISKFLEATIRGGFGYALKGDLCLFKGRECPDCLLRETCGYSRFFEPAPPASSTLQHDMQQAARSYMFHAAQFCDKVQLEITLVGGAHDYLEKVLHTMQSVGREGLGKSRTRFSICAVQPSALYDLSRQPIKAETAATVSFTTPFTLRSQGSFAKEWNTRLFFATLLRRISNLAAIHGVPLPAEFDPREILEQADKTQSEAFLVPVSQERNSTHQKRTINYSGLVGDIISQGLTPQLNQVLQAGELISVGKNTAFGYGKYSLEYASK